MTISAVIPVKDGARFIEGALDSLMRQGDLITEVIVVNNGSTDSTGEIVENYNDERVRLVNSDIPNLPLSRNIGASHATGEWLYFLDADDRVFEGALKRLLDARTEDASLAVIYGDYRRLTHDGKAFGERSILPSNRKPDGDVLAAFLTGNKMIVGSQIVRRDWFEQVGGFDPDIRFAEDWELWCRMANVAKFKFVPDLFVLGYTMQPQSMSHHQVLPFDRFKKVLDVIFQNPALADRSDLQSLRTKAEANCKAYICTEAVRMNSHGQAFKAYLQTIQHHPAGLPRNTAKYLGAYFGL